MGKREAIATMKAHATNLRETAAAFKRQGMEVDRNRAANKAAAYEHCIDIVKHHVREGSDG